ncbi:MAG: hypothetical protein R3F20_11745 [Planctomycetota bacterium]
MISRLFTLALPLALAAATACTSSPSDALVKLPILEPAADSGSAAPRLESSPELDARNEDDNHLAIIDEMRQRQVELEERLRETEQKLEGAQEKTVMATESEERLSADLDRLRGLLEQSRERERDYQRQVILARLEAIRRKQEIVKREIDGLAPGAER